MATTWEKSYPHFQPSTVVDVGPCPLLEIRDRDLKLINEPVLGAGT
jgi:hypothetical protein